LIAAAVILFLFVREAARPEAGPAGRFRRAPVTTVSSSTG
jgi:hypothetical protein